MPSILKSFLPWIVFFALCNNASSSIEIAVIAALIAHVIFNIQSLKKWFVLDIGALVFFVLLAVNIFVLKNKTITDNAYLIANCALALIAWISLIILKMKKDRVFRQIIIFPILFLEVECRTLCWGKLILSNLVWTWSQPILCCFLRSGFHHKQKHWILKI